MIRRFDARGLKCPLPVLKARRQLKEMAPGEALEVLADDPGAPEDFRHFCATAGHELLSLAEAAPGVFSILLRARGSGR